MKTRIILLATVSVCLPLVSLADDATIPSVSDRFAAAPTDVSEVPDFQRHVVPLIGKMGCNGRACHGSFQGRGGFRLSLFGYDFKSDHDELYGRLDPETPTESLILQKPLMQVQHEGGPRLKEGSWEHNLLLKWVQSDGPPRADDAAKLTKVEVSPAEIQFTSKDQNQQLTVVAIWADGTREDVTALCRFQSNDDQVADITADGLVMAGSTGDTHVVVFYDSAVVPVAVLRPVSDKAGSAYPKVEAPTRIDRLVVQKLRKLGVVQSDLCTDEQFLRRASLDVTGTLPTPDEVRSFVADNRSDKRTRKIDELLSRPGYAAWWTTLLCDFTGNSNDQLNNVTPVRTAASQQWYDWIHERVEKNVAYDDLVEGIVMAVSRDPGESYEEYCENVSALYAKDTTTSFAERQFLPHFWSRRNFQSSEDRVIGFAYTFLGTRIQCAQCHKHPFDQWTQDDYQQFEGFFKSTVGRTNNPRPESRDEYKSMLEKLDGTDGLKGGQLRNALAKELQKGTVIPFGEVYATPARASSKRRKKGRQNKPAPVTARLLGGDTIDLTQFKDVRQPLMDWLRSPDNPLFAKAFVNRVWASYFNVGIVHPADNLNLANPPGNAALLNYLAEGFVQHDFDMKWLHREILNSRTYQLSWVPNETNAHDEHNFSRAVPRRLPAEVTYDMLTQSLANNAGNTECVTDLEGRAVMIPGSGVRNRNRNPAAYALTIFGRSIRESNCDCDRSAEPSLLQTIFLRNDKAILSLIDDRDGWLAEVAKENGLQFEASSNPNDRAKNARSKAAKSRFQKLLKDVRQKLAKAKADQNDGQIARLEKQLAQRKRQAKQAGLDVDLTTSVDSRGKSEGTAASGNSVPDSWNTDALVVEAYLRTLSRFPATQEAEIAADHIQSSKDPVDGLRSVLWALVNTKEFIVNH
jgi:Protein of unknown function (DUF1549)/Protein of unknown function (DUF1553)